MTSDSLHKRLVRCLRRATTQVCGGNFQQDLMEDVHSSISFPNKHDDTSGKPHDVEIKLALTLFHYWKRRNGTVITISDYGLERSISSPKHLASLLCTALESACDEEGIAYDIRFQPSGMISIVTPERSRRLRQAGKLPCPFCIKWCHGMC